MEKKTELRYLCVTAVIIVAMLVTGYSVGAYFESETKKAEAQQELEMEMVRHKKVWERE